MVQHVLLKFFYRECQLCSEVVAGKLRIQIFAVSTLLSDRLIDGVFTCILHGRNLSAGISRSGSHARAV